MFYDSLLGTIINIMGYNRLNDKQKLNVITDYSNGMKMKEISSKYNISHVTVWNICKNSVKKHLTESDAINIIASYKLGNITQRELAEKYKVGRTTITSIINGQNFRTLIKGEQQKYNKCNLKVTRH